MSKVKKASETSNKPFDFILFITVLLMLSLGIVMVLSASSPSALAETGDSYSYVKTQLVSAILGIILMLIISKIDYHFYRKFYKIAYWGSLALLLAVAIPGVGYTANGATRWINLGFTTIQPSEIVKIALIIFFATYLSNHKDELKGLWSGFFKPFLILAPIILVLILVQDHLSASLVIILIISIMMIIAGTKIKHFLTFGVAGAGIGAIGLVLMAKFTEKGAFRLARLTSFLDPWKYAQDEGWQIIQSLYAIGSGGLFGVGLGQSKQKYLYIPEPHNDFIFAVLAEELGFVGCAVVILLFAIFIWRGILVAMKAPDMYGSLVAIGITSLVGIQAIINIAVVTSSIPNTGMPLPFFSYGGTALLILLCAMRSFIKYFKKCKKSLIRLQLCNLIVKWKKGGRQ